MAATSRFDGSKVLSKPVHQSDNSLTRYHDSCGRIVFSTLCCIAGHSELGAWKAYGDPRMDFGDT